MVALAVDGGELVDTGYAPTYFTVDSVVLHKGHVLLIQRRYHPGKGLFLVRRMRLLDELQHLGVDLRRGATGIAIGEHRVLHRSAESRSGKLANPRRHPCERQAEQSSQLFLFG